jgi:hypothetical protein
MLQLHRCLFILVISFVMIISATAILYPMQDHQPILSQYEITHKVSNGLKVYTKFTGQQFLIINNDPFDWVDVTLAVNAKQTANQAVSETRESNELVLAVPRIRSGGTYTLGAGHLSANISTQPPVLTAQAYHLSIVSMTPWGKSSWDGRWE